MEIKEINVRVLHNLVTTEVKDESGVWHVLGREEVTHACYLYVTYKLGERFEIQQEAF